MQITYKKTVILHNILNEWLFKKACLNKMYFGHLLQIMSFLGKIC